MFTSLFILLYAHYDTAVTIFGAHIFGVLILKSKFHLIFASSHRLSLFMMFSTIFTTSLFRLFQCAHLYTCRYTTDTIQTKGMNTWSCTGLFLAVLAKWLTGKVLANDLAHFCEDNINLCNLLDGMYTL